VVVLLVSGDDLLVDGSTAFEAFVKLEYYYEHYLVKIWSNIVLSADWFYDSVDPSNIFQFSIRATRLNTDVHFVFDDDWSASKPPMHLDRYFLIQLSF
jgi:hypothetical protein